MDLCSKYLSTLQQTRRGGRGRWPIFTSAAAIQNNWREQFRGKLRHCKHSWPLAVGSWSSKGAIVSLTTEMSDLWRQGKLDSYMSLQNPQQWPKVIKTTLCLWLAKKEGFLQSNWGWATSGDGKCYHWAKKQTQQKFKSKVGQPKPGRIKTSYLPKPTPSQY